MVRPSDQPELPSLRRDPRRAAAVALVRAEAAMEEVAFEPQPSLPANEPKAAPARGRGPSTGSVEDTHANRSVGRDTMFSEEHRVVHVAGALFGDQPPE